MLYYSTCVYNYVGTFVQVTNWTLSQVSTVETISMIFSYLVNFYLQIQNPINPISMPTTYLELFGADLSENKLFQCVSILLTGTSTIVYVFSSI